MYIVSISVVVFLLINSKFSCGNILNIRSKREVTTLIICNNGDFTAQCKYGTTVYINSAQFGRQSSKTICSREGLGVDKICQSRTALNNIRKECRGKNLCTMKVNVDTLGDPVTSMGESCVDTSYYLELKYSCVKDCNPPYVEFNVQLIGNYHIGSTVKVVCREGYERYGGYGPLEKTCLEDGSWTRGSILCKDTDECMLKSMNRCHQHAKCTNTQGSYACECLEEYSGDGFSCTSESWFNVGGLAGNGSQVVTDYFWDEADIDVHDEKICGSRILRLRKGTIKSPGFPKFYPSMTACTWVVIVPPGLVVEIVFTKFQLEDAKPNAGCSRDNVTLYDGISRNPRRYLGSFCGDESPGKILTQNNQLRIEFKSDIVGNFPGFEAKFSARNLGNACNNFDAHFYSGVLIVNGSRNATTLPGENVTLSCDSGYRVTSVDLVRVCLDDGTWSNIENPCTAISCGPPPVPLDKEGLIISGDPEQYAYNQPPVRYACTDGYRLRLPTGNDGLVYCDKRGQWSNAYATTTPTCQRIQCLVTEAEIPNRKEVTWIVYDELGDRIPYPVGQSLSHGSQIEYGCVKGYALVSEEIRTCTANGWTGRNVLCEEDNGIEGLSNLQIAIIAAALSGAVIIVVGIGLILCCVRSRRKKEAQKSYQRHMRAARDNDGFIMNFAGHNGKGSGGQRRGRNNNLGAYGHGSPNSTFNYGQPVPEQGDFYARAIAPRANQHGRYDYPTQDNRPRTNQTFQAPADEIRIPQSYNDPMAPGSKMSLPMPQGYQDPPPSYDTMLRNSNSNRSKKSSKSDKKKKKNGSRRK